MLCHNWSWTSTPPYSLPPSPVPAAAAAAAHLTAPCCRPSQLPGLPSMLGAKDRNLRLASEDPQPLHTAEFIKGQVMLLPRKEFPTVRNEGALLVTKRSRHQ